MPVARGVYANPARIAGLSAGGQGLLAATASLALAGPRAVVSHQAAAVIHDLALLSTPSSGVSSITRSPDGKRGRRLRPGVSSHTAALPGRHVTVTNGIPVTSVERTVVDLARTLPFAAGVVTADSALFQEKTTASRLYRVVADCARWPGIVRAREVVAFCHPGAESPLESISRVAFRDGGLPPPVLQAWVIASRGPVGRVDFLWDDHRTIAEADGAMKYADPSRARQQLRRDTELRQAGYEVVHFTWRDINTRPDYVIAQIREAFSRSARLRAGARAG